MKDKDMLMYIIKNIEAIKAEKAVDNLLCQHSSDKGCELEENKDGTVSCPKCGEKFTLVKDSVEDISELIDRIIDIIQTSKTLYFSKLILNDYVSDDNIDICSLIIPILKMIPEEYRKSVQCFNEAMDKIQYNNPVPPRYTNNPFRVNPFLQPSESDSLLYNGYNISHIYPWQK